MILVMLLTAAVALYWVAGPPASEESPPPVTYTTIKASEIIAAFEENEVAAELKFKGTRWRVTGSITSIGKEILGKPYVILNRGVQCVFPRESAQQVATFRKGREITVYCTGRSKLIDVLMDCTVN